MTGAQAVQMQKDIFAISEKEDNHVQPISDLVIPDHFMCPISRDIMEDPVTLTSGRSFERELIVQHLKYMRELGEREEADASDDEKIGVENWITCPISLLPVDPEVIIPNIQLKKAIELYLKQNPWAYRQHRKDNFKNVHIWDEWEGGSQEER